VQHVHRIVLWLITFYLNSRLMVKRQGRHEVARRHNYSLYCPGAQKLSQVVGRVRLRHRRLWRAYVLRATDAVCPAARRSRWCGCVSGVASPPLPATQFKRVGWMVVHAASEEKPFPSR